MTEQPKVEFAKMDDAQCEQLLDRHWFGRVAFATTRYIDIEPLSYVRSGKWLFGRTSKGMKLNVLGHQPWVAFEVDEVAGPHDWKCVIVHGVFHQLTEDGTASDKETHTRALEALRETAPETLTGKDPVPHRSVIFGIHIDLMSGRQSVSR